MTASQAIDAFVEQVAAGLPGPPRERGDMMAELRSGLLDAVDAHRQDGMPDDAAVAAATADFGEPRVIAATFRPGARAVLQGRGLHRRDGVRDRLNNAAAALAFSSVFVVSNSLRLLRFRP